MTTTDKNTPTHQHTQEHTGQRKYRVQYELYTCVGVFFSCNDMAKNTYCTTTDKMAQHAILFPRLQINSKIFHYRPFDELPSFTSSLFIKLF